MFAVISFVNFALCVGSYLMILEIPHIQIKFCNNFNKHEDRRVVQLWRGYRVWACQKSSQFDQFIRKKILVWNLNAKQTYHKLPHRQGIQSYVARIHQTARDTAGIERRTRK